MQNLMKLPLPNINIDAYYRITGKFGEYYIWRMGRLNVLAFFNLAFRPWLRMTGTGHSPCRLILAIFNLAILAKIRQIAKLKLSPNFPVIRYFVLLLL